MDRKVKRPRICVPPRMEERSAPMPIDNVLAPLEGSASDFVDAIIAAGGMPVLMPMTHDDSLIAEYVQLCSGLAIPGGEDVDPALWGSEDPYDESLLNRDRDKLELALIKGFRAAHKPIFATCRGMQILNVAYGGSLDMAIEKRQPLPGMMLWHHMGILASPAHPVDITEGSLLYHCVGDVSTIHVNSSHHCSVLKLGKGLNQTGQATDGIPEAIEDPRANFVLGVQWHPEYTWQHSKTDACIWRSFVDACRA